MYTFDWTGKNGTKHSIRTYGKEYAPDTRHVVPPSLTGKTELSICYGAFYMVQTFRSSINGVSDAVQVTVYDNGAKNPLMWSMTMTKQQARGARDLFENIGYFDKPIAV